MSEQKKQRRSYAEEYKRESAGLAIDTGRSVAAVPGVADVNLGIGGHRLRGLDGR